MLRRALFILALLALGPAPAAFAAALDALPGAGDMDIPLPAAPAFDRARTLVCVDPGHPNSFNPATDTVNGTNENRINWQVGVRLARVLNERGYDVAMTRNSELNYVENKDRARFCNIGSALVVHLHCESTPGTGFALYYPDRQGVHDYKDDPENGFRGPEQSVITASKPLAETIAAAMERGLAGDLRRKGVYGDSRTAVGSRQGALTYSIFSRIPTVTIEMVVLTNKNDAAFIKSEGGQEKMAKAIAEGIGRYLTP